MTALYTSLFTLALTLSLSTMFIMVREYWGKAMGALLAVHANEIPLWDGPADPDPFYGD